MTSRSRILPLALAPLLALGALANPAAASSEYVDADLGEIPTGVAVSDKGVIAASLFNGQDVAVVALDGTVREIPIGCSPSDVAISPDGATAWAVCQASDSLHVIETESGTVSGVTLDVAGLDDVVYLPDVDQLFVASLEGQIIQLTGVMSGDYVFGTRVALPQDEPHRVTQLAPLSGGEATYAITDSGDLIYVDVEFGGQYEVVARASATRSFQSVVMSPYDTALYAAVVDYSTADIKNTVEIVDVATGASRQSVLLEAVTPGSTTIELTAGYRAVYAAFGLYVNTPTGTTGLLTIEVGRTGRLGRAEGVDVPTAGGSATAISADGSRVAFGTTNAGAVGLTVDGEPYPATIRVAAKATGAKVTVTGTTTSMRPLTALTVYIKDLTKKKTRFVKQARPALLNYQGDVTWNGRTPSKRFALYLSGGGAKSATITVTAR